MPSLRLRLVFVPVAVFIGACGLSVPPMADQEVAAWRRCEKVNDIGNWPVENAPFGANNRCWQGVVAGLQEGKLVGPCLVNGEAFLCSDGGGPGELCDPAKSGGMMGLVPTGKTFQKDDPTIVYIR